MNAYAEQLAMTGLLIRLVEGDLDDRDMDTLLRWSRSCPQAVEEYCEFLKDYSVIRSHIAGLVNQPSDLLEDSHFNEAVWKALQEVETTAPGISIAPPIPQPQPPTTVKGKSRRPDAPVSRFSLYALLASSAALMLLIVYAHVGSSGRGVEVATVSDTLHARWADSNRDVYNGMRLTTHSGPLRLREGAVRLTFDDGSRVVLEGPAEFEILTEDQIQLHDGRLYAAVPKHAIGFTVRTLHSKIIDLGTEFGVKTNPDGTELHVMYGRAMLISGSRKDELTEGQAMAVTQAGEVKPIALNQTGFVRQIDSGSEVLWKGQAINLADLVGGGNGLGTGRIGAGVDPLDGRAVKTLTPRYNIFGSGGYEAVLWSPYIDGVFVPDGEQGPVTVTSQGHTFAECPDTNGQFWTEITNGGQLSDPVEHTPPQFRLQGREYGTAQNPALFMHANVGITFDLQAIRALVPGVKIAEFTALAGISENGPRRSPYADFWVLVDGQVRFCETGVDGTRICPVAVPIDGADRFLTLMVTDGGQEVCLKIDGVPFVQDGDWGLFADPQLSTEPQ